MLLVLTLFIACAETEKIASRQNREILMTKTMIQPRIELLTIRLFGSYKNHYTMAPRSLQFLCSCK